MEYKIEIKEKSKIDIIYMTSLERFLIILIVYNLISIKEVNLTKNGLNIIFGSDLSL